MEFTASSNGNGLFPLLEAFSGTAFTAARAVCGMWKSLLHQHSAISALFVNVFVAEWAKKTTSIMKNYSGQNYHIF